MERLERCVKFRVRMEVVKRLEISFFGSIRKGIQECREIYTEIVQ